MRFSPAGEGYAGHENRPYSLWLVFPLHRKKIVLEKLLNRHVGVKSLRLLILRGLKRPKASIHFKTVKTGLFSLPPRNSKGVLDASC